MNGIEKITDRIGEDARKEIKAVKAKAEAEAAEVLARYEAQAEKETDDILKRGNKSAEERVDRLGSVARLEAKKLTLAARQEILGRAFDLALEQLTNLPEDEYVKLLARLAAGASKTGREQVVLSQKDRTRFGKQIVTQANELLGANGALTLAEEVRPMRGGLVLQGERVEANCSFETLVRLQREQIAAEVAEVLFDGAQ